MSTERVAFFDNTRFIAIVLVVWGHSLTRTIGDSGLSATVYLWLYAFHVPLFVALAGYFAHSTPPDRHRMQRIFTDLVLPYLLLETLWSIVWMVQRGQFHYDPLRPSWTLWFLLSLIAWRILLPYLLTLRWPLAVSVVVSVASGYFAVDQTLSLARTLGLLPFFVLGSLLASRGSLRRLSDPSIPRHWLGTVLALVVIAGTLALSWLFSDALIDSGARWLFTYDRPYVEAGLPQWWAGVGRLGTLGLAAALCLAVLWLVPRATTWFTRYGQATLYVYLLHSFVLAPLRGSGILAGDFPWWGVVLTLVGSVVLTVLLSTKPVRQLTGPLIQPGASWFFARTAPDSRGHDAKAR